MKYLICNLKSNKNLKEMKEYAKTIYDINTSTTLVICPSDLYLTCIKSHILGAQDISEYDMGPYTGEVNGEQLASLNVKYVLVGHSERRKYFQESEETLKNKIKQALKNEMKVVYCIGETKEEYSMKKTYVVLEHQIGRILNEYTKEELKNIIIAYEPVWSISDGKTPAPTPTKKEISDVISFIKKLTKEYYELDFDVLYGGSANEKNVDEIKTIKSVDGLLVGGASLYPEKIISMLESIGKKD